MGAALCSMVWRDSAPHRAIHLLEVCHECAVCHQCTGASHALYLKTPVTLPVRACACSRGAACCVAAFASSLEHDLAGNASGTAQPHGRSAPCLLQRGYQVLVEAICGGALTVWAAHIKPWHPSDARTTPNTPNCFGCLGRNTWNKKLWALIRFAILHM